MDPNQPIEVLKLNKITSIAFILFILVSAVVAQGYEDGSPKASSQSFQWLSLQDCLITI